MSPPWNPAEARSQRRHEGQGASGERGAASRCGERVRRVGAVSKCVRAMPSGAAGMHLGKVTGAQLGEKVVVRTACVERVNVRIDDLCLEGLHLLPRRRRHRHLARPCPEVEPLDLIE